MILLIINKPGLIIEIPGLHITRTPAEFDITKLNPNMVLTYLKKMGIQDYQIISSDKETKTYPKYVWKDLLKKEQNNETLENRVIQILNNFTKKSNTQQSEVEVNTKGLEEKLSQFATVIEKLIKQVPSTITISGSGSQIVEKEKEVPDEEKFIPDIKNGEMSLRGSISTVISEENQNDVLEVADMLRGV